MAELNLGHVVGPGVPTGGTSGQVLKKNSSTNFDTSWTNNDATTIPMSSSDSTSINEAISNLENYTQITGNNKSAIESALLTFSSSMANGEERLIWFANQTASDPMGGTTYIGSIGKSEGRLIVQVHGISSVIQDLTGWYKSGTGWEWQSLNRDIAKSNSDENTTTDILASALTATRTTFFKGSGSGYTGNVPAQSALNYGSFIVNVRNTYRYVIGVNTEGKVFTNVYGGSSWYGWQELATKKIATGTTSFSALDGNSYASKALDNIHAQISSLSSGIHQVESGGGPYYFVVLGKYTNSYYGGYLFTYATSETTLSYRFAYQNGTYAIYVTGK